MLTSLEPLMRAQRLQTEAVKSIADTVNIYDCHMCAQMHTYLNVFCNTSKFRMPFKLQISQFQHFAQIMGRIYSNSIPLCRPSTSLLKHVIAIK